MYTCCPNCNTCFRISKPQLDVAQGHVRCGTCAKVFNGKQYLHNEMPGKQDKNPRLAEKEKKTKNKTPLRPSTKPKARKPVKKKPQQKSTTRTATPRRQSTQVKSVNKASDPSTSPPPDIDLYDYTSISRVQDASRLSSKSDFAEQDINDIFDDLESQHALRQPRLTAENKPVRQKISPKIISDNTSKPEDDGAGSEDTAIIDLSTKEDEWLNELTSDVDSNDPAKDTNSAQRKVTKPSTTPKTQAKKSPTKSAAPVKTTTLTRKKTSRYEYVDPNELLKEEKGINEILQDMNKQLSLEIDTSKPEEADESDISGMFKQVMHESKSDSNPVHNNKDDFESSFLASLDSATLNANPETQQKIKSPVDPTRIKTLQPDTTEKSEKPPPAEIKDEFNLSHQAGAADLPGDVDDVPYQLRDNFADDTPPRSAKMWLMYIAASFVLIVSILLQLVIFRSTDIADHYPALESTLTRLCNTLPCRYTGPQDVSQIKLLSRDIRLHPKEEKALLITATMVNQAKFKQPYPDIMITLSDLSGDVIARRQFSADKYLDRIYTPLLRMPSGQPVKIALEVIDPGRDAVNFEFTFH